MDMIPVDRARRLGHRFDVFLDTVAPPKNLVMRGLTRPLVVSGAELVWGFAILEEALGCGRKQLAAVEVTGRPEDLLATALELEGRTDGYTHREKLRILELAEELGVDAASPRIASLVQRKGAFTEQAGRYRELCDGARTLADAGRLDPVYASRLDRIPSEVWDALSRRAGLSRSTVRIVSTMLDEIARRDGPAAGDIGEVADEVLRSPDPLATVTTLRYPLLSDMRRRFEELRRAALSDTDVKLHAPESFEGDGFTVELDFASCEQLERRLEAAARLRDYCDELLDLL